MSESKSSSDAMKDENSSDDGFWGPRAKQFFERHSEKDYLSRKCVSFHVDVPFEKLWLAHKQLASRYHIPLNPDYGNLLIYETFLLHELFFSEAKRLGVDPCVYVREQLELLKRVKTDALSVVDVGRVEVVRGEVIEELNGELRKHCSLLFPSG